MLFIVRFARQVSQIDLINAIVWTLISKLVLALQSTFFLQQLFDGSSKNNIKPRQY